MQNDLKRLGNRLLGSDLNFLKTVKNGSGKIGLRFWAIFPGQVQNDLKWLGKRLLGSDLNFLENVENGSGKNLVTLLGNFTRSGAE